MSNPNAKKVQTVTNEVKNLSVETMVEAGSNPYKKDSKSGWFPETLDVSAKNVLSSIGLFPYSLLKVQNGKIQQTFQLPITPQQLDISTPFAINLTPTLNGVVEEHNSTRFREISMAGTMGVLPNRGHAKLKDIESNASLLVGAIGIADLTEATIASVPYAQILALREQNAVKPNDTDDKTGYQNLHRLRNFLETYAEEKKTNSQLRLVFANYKDGHFYYVTPVNFVVRRSAESPLEYRYQLSLRSWGRYDPSVRVVAFSESTTSRISAVAAVTNALASVRALSSAIGNVIPWGVSVSTSIVSAFGSITSDFGQSIRNLTLESLGRQGQALGGYASALFDSLSSNLYEQAAVNSSVTPEPNAQDYTSSSAAVREQMTGLSDALGMSSASFDALFDREPVPTLVPNPSPEQLDIMFASNRISMGLNTLSANALREQPATTSPMEYVAGLASKSGIAFTVPVSKFPVPFPYGSTLENLANAYLGDPNRWLEIATLNGLQEPYIDHVGFDVPLAVNGNGNKIVIGRKDIQPTQAISLFSITQLKSTYTVLSVKELTPTLWELTLNNDPVSDNLNRFATSEKAYLHTYLPNTVRAGQMIYIPSNEAVDESSFNTYQIPDLNQYESIIRVSGVDFLLSNSRQSQVCPTLTTQMVQASGVGDTYVVLQNANNMLPNDTLVIGTGITSETKTIVSVSGVRVNLSSALAYVHASGTSVSRNRSIVLDVPQRVGAFDLVVDPSTGNVPYSAGLTNIQQSLLLILFTPLGALLQHPDFGVGVPVGQSVADISLSEFSDQIKKAILADPSFSEVPYLTVDLDKSVLSIKLIVRVAEVNRLLPLSFDVNLRRA